MATSARERSAVITALVVVLVGMLLYAVAILVAPTERSDGTCAGIGFGCSPAPRDMLVLSAFFVVLPVMVCTAVTCPVAILVLLRHTRLPGVVVGLIGTIGGGLVAAAVTLGFLTLI
ncbi:hypothetical protein BH708_15005 [Brachybacterium sp. P6-10-X1]|uniref:hypothetical protein n=1 Tax=Brachybacterium sp. P6-10-X1 TaxID=1903186 RepID=UPI000971A373|nr:hypothetical protein [Brachybacterium sp. P6-10-X1]APX33804.1 hypothetical protein BH708_15005 [Brachybacterium sp. P6-10-X1]